MLSHSNNSLKIQLLINVGVMSDAVTLDFFLYNYVFEEDKSHLKFNEAKMDRTCHFNKRVGVQ